MACAKLSSLQIKLPLIIILNNIFLKLSLTKMPENVIEFWKKQHIIRTFFLNILSVRENMVGNNSAVLIVGQCCGNTICPRREDPDTNSRPDGDKMGLFSKLCNSLFTYRRTGTGRIPRSCDLVIRQELEACNPALILV